ncbi:hypothetical protein MPSEU_000053800 [Mayamaea pseudoterrestris]|nr:hypothetical protein MPSEU_000053800 [Mayamaea pseudoterrestris]
MSFRPGTPMPLFSSVVASRAAHYEATIRCNASRNDGRSRSFLTNVAARSVSMSPRRRSFRQRQSSLTSVSDIEAEYNRITGNGNDEDDAASVQSLPVHLEYQYAATTTKVQQQQSTDDVMEDDDENCSVASTIVSHNDVGDYMYFDALPEQEANWKEQLSHTANTKCPVRPPLLISTSHGRAPSPIKQLNITPPAYVSPPRHSQAFSRKKRVFETQQHCNRTIQRNVAPPPLVAKANDHAGTTTSKSASLQMGDVLVNIYAQSRQGDKTDRISKSLDYNNDTTSSSAVFTIMEEDDEGLSSDDDESIVISPIKNAVQRSASTTMLDHCRAASPSLFLGRFLRSSSGSLSGSITKNTGKTLEVATERKKSLSKRGLTRSARWASRGGEHGSVVY